MHAYHTHGKKQTTTRTTKPFKLEPFTAANAYNVASTPEAEGGGFSQVPGQPGFHAILQQETLPQTNNTYFSLDMIDMDL